MQGYMPELVERDYPFTPENIWTIIEDRPLDMKILRNNLNQFIHEKDEWHKVLIDGENSSTVGWRRFTAGKCFDYFIDMLQVEPQKMGWIYIPPYTTGQFHRDPLPGSGIRYTSININMHMEEESGTFFFDTQPHLPSTVYRVPYPVGKMTLLNINEGHVILNYGSTDRFLLTISFGQRYHELLGLHKEGKLFR